MAIAFASLILINLYSLSNLSKDHWEPFATSKSFKGNLFIKKEGWVLERRSFLNFLCPDVAVRMLTPHSQE